MRRRNIAGIVRLLSLLAVALPLSAHAALERVGPVNPATGYPDWYQDRTGLMLDFCGPASDPAEYAGGWCLLLPGTIPNGPPEVAFSNWSVEHFYWAGNSNIVGANFKAKLVLSVEGSFAGLTVVPGAQITFARIRIFIPSAPISGEYRIYHPFGVMVVPGQVAGSRVFLTQDVGLGCAPGQFDCVLATPIGPFLLPSAAPGGAELAPLPILDPLTGCTAAGVCDPFFPGPSTSATTGFPGTGKLYLADPARNGPVTGSPLAPFVSPADGLTYNPNRFRIEVLQPGATVPVVLGDTTAFAVNGRVFNQAVPGRVTLDRASYARSATTPNKLDVYATALPTVQGRVPPATALPPVQPQLVYYDAPCGIDPVTGALTVPVDPLTLLPLPQNPMNSAVGWKYVVGQSAPAVLPAAVCVEETNAVNLAGQVVPIFAQAPVADQVFITEALFNPNTGALSVKASSSDQTFPPVLTVGGYGDICFVAPCLNGAVPGQLIVPLAAPPNKVTVASPSGGLNEALVGSLYFNAPINNSPIAANDAFTVNEDCSPTASITPCPVPQVLPILANDTIAGGPLPAGGVVAITSAPLLGTATVNLDGTVSYTPNLNANGTDGFSYTVTVNGFVSNIATATITIAPINDFPVAVADAFSVGTVLPMTTPTSVNVFANDTDPDGAGDLGAAINLIPVSAPAGAVWSVTGGAGGLVSFQASVAGTYTFTYQAQDKGGKQAAPAPLLVSNVATATVVVTGETITITKSQYVVAQNRWVVTGTYTPTAAVVTLTISLANGTAAGTVIGTAPNVGGLWTLDFKPATGVLDPRTTGATQIRVTSPNTPPGGGALAPITLK